MDSTDEYLRRLANVERAMANHGVDYVLLNRSNTIKYLTGASSTCSFVLLGKDGRRVAFVLEPDYLEYSHQSVISDVRVHRSYYPEMPFRRIRDELGMRPGSLAAETEHLKAHQYEMVVAKLFGDALNREACADRIVEEARAVKTPEEIEKLRGASRLVDLGMRVARENAVKGVAETALKHGIIGAMLEAGADEGAYVYVASGGRSSLVHTSPSRNRLESGPLVVDIHASYEGYFSDVARTIFLEDPDGEQQDAYALLRDAVASTIGFMTPGVTLPEVRRFFYEKLKLREEWIPLMGPVVHGIGVHRPEAPRFYFPGVTAYPGKLESGMTISCSNIGVSSRKGWGVKYEDTFVVGEKGPEILTVAES